MILKNDEETTKAVENSLLTQLDVLFLQSFKHVLFVYLSLFLPLGCGKNVFTV